jgi:uncharacterized protein YkwD
MSVAAPPAPPPMVIVADINRARARFRLKPLLPTRSLQKMAAIHDQDMLHNGFFSHNGEGTTFGGRVRRHVHFRSVGEAIEFTTARATAWTIVRMWLKSPPHRAELLSPTFQRIGLSDATGRLGRYGTGVVVTADFATLR